MSNKMSLKVILVFVCLNYIFNTLVRSDDNIRNTTSGSVRGLNIEVLNRSIDQYLNIPFAEPPVGNLRFAKPKAIENATEAIIDGTQPGNSCPQEYDESMAGFLGNLTLSEDCLVLNIWSPKSDKSLDLKPVMFWIYGGGLQLGSIFQPQYNGSILAAQDVVFVSTNYRLGNFGFLYGNQSSAPGNVGFYDQVLALQWVKNNIHLFGGDKDQITIFGESAGSWSVSCLLLSPLADGLFKRAILESGAQFFSKDSPIVSTEEALQSAKQLAKNMNCSDDSQWLKCLRGLDYKLLIPQLLTNQFTFPVEDTEFLPLSAQTAFRDKKFNKDLDIIAGVCRDEGSNLAITLDPLLLFKNLTKDDFVAFVTMVAPQFHIKNLDQVTEYYLRNTNLNDKEAIKWKIFDFFGDILIKCPIYQFAKGYAEHSSLETNVFFYELTHSSNSMLLGQNMGVQHGADLPFVFGNLLLDHVHSSIENIAFSIEVMKLWTDFAKSGKPDNNWPKMINEKSNSIINIKDLNPTYPDKYFENLFDDNCDGFWKDYYIQTFNSVEDLAKTRISLATFAVIFYYFRQFLNNLF